MRAWPTLARLSRPAIAVAALYALVLSVFLAGIAPGPVALVADVLCAPQAGSSVPHQPWAEGRDCCSLAAPAGSALPAPTSSLAAAQRVPVAIAWAMPPAPAGDAAPIHDARARGPPPV
jgi:hypothetical protein